MDSIYTWFAVQNNKSGSLENLLRTYQMLAVRYFQCEEKTLFDTLKMAEQKEDSNKNQRFIRWMFEKAVPGMKKLASLDLFESAEIKAKIEYENYILQQELDLDYPDDARACLMEVPSTFLHELQGKNK